MWAGFCTFRLGHWGPLYKSIHKIHHEWTAPIAVTAIYCHPLEHLFCNVLPLSAGMLIMSSHLLTATIWSVEHYSLHQQKNHTSSVVGVWVCMCVCWEEGVDWKAVFQTPPPFRHTRQWICISPENQLQTPTHNSVYIFHLFIHSLDLHANAFFFRFLFFLIFYVHQPGMFTRYLKTGVSKHLQAVQGSKDPWVQQPYQL